jgi:delta 1-pyrroline-5-carboxylate dehydrogenase
MPVVIVYALAHAVGALKAAARAGRPIVLASAADAGDYAGPGWFKELVEAAREAVPAADCSSLLDCGASVGAALAAIRAQVDGVVFTGGADTARRLADIAGQHGVHFQTRRPTPTIDLAGAFFASAEQVERCCRRLLERGGHAAAPASPTPRA